jgi:peptidoglycan/LPS O-acetylase OafA/YrhL
MTVKRPELKTLTTLRFFAALHVLAFHALPIVFGVSYLGLPAWLQNFVMSGHLAVPFFFTLSGFVLYYAYSGGDSPAAAPFWKRRYARLAPVFYVSVVVGLPMYWLGLRPEKGVAVATLLSLKALLANLLFVQTFVLESLGINYPAWSLTAEAFFYFTFPFLFPRLRKLSGGSAWGVLLGAFLASTLITLILFRMVAPAAAWPRNLYFVNPGVAAFLQNNPFTHWGEFLVGLCLARIFELRGPLGARASTLAMLAGFALVVLAGISGTIPLTFIATFLLVPAFGLIVYGGAGARCAGTRWLESSALVLLGEASYALYILHEPVIPYFVGAQALFFPRLSPWAGILLLMALMALLSLASLRWLERPMRKKLLGHAG